MRSTLFLALTMLTLAAAPVRADDHAEVRGMTVSCPTWGGEWGTDEMVETMRLLRDHGVNWIAIHPYAGIRADGTVTMRRRVYDDPTWLTRPIEEAHKLGLKIMIKPHLAYWGSPFSWRGEIEFDDAAEWSRFFTTYETWVTRVAEICADADAFAVGTELDRTIGHDAEWRAIITKTRARLSCPLTYCANWDAYERVPFWNALDAIGIQSYFPLVSEPGVPSPAEIRAGWSRTVRTLEAFAERLGKPIVLGELGYNRSENAAYEPWDYRQGGEQGEHVQAMCLAAALDAIERSEVITGAFLWKWFPGEHGRGSFIKSTPAMRSVIRGAWAER